MIVSGKSGNVGGISNFEEAATDCPFAREQVEIKNEHWVCCTRVHVA